MSFSVNVELATGLLTINSEPSALPLKRLLGFASRFSSQRKFLLVSKVLGKHYPVAPLMMRWSYRALARKILSLTNDPLALWIGMAETATGLGYGIYAAARAEGLAGGLFMQTTRYHIHGHTPLDFQEAHSHASDFFLYLPEQPALRQQFLHATTLLLMDDEISTGKTFLRLIQAYQEVNTSLKQVFIVSLVNFASLVDRQALEDAVGISVHWLYLHSGSLTFTEYNTPTPMPSPINVSSNQRCKQHLLAWPGRLGIPDPIALDQHTLWSIQTYLPKPSEQQRPILVLGTGECNAPAFLLAELLERQAYAVKVQATTRSPILLGQAIGSIESFLDNYEDQIPNFIYNLNPNSYQAIILCHETPLNAPLLDLLNRWQAISARFELLKNPAYATLHFCRP